MHKTVALLLASVLWPSVLLLVRIMQIGVAGIERQLEESLGLFIMDMMTYVLIGYIATYLLYIVLKPKQRPVLTVLPVTGYLLATPLAIFIAVIVARIYPVIGLWVYPVITISALLPIVGGVALGFMCAKVWSWATPDRSI